MQPPSRLHISTPGIGVDGERGYNSSHCIGFSRVIGPSPSLLFFSLSASRPPQPLRIHPPIVSHFLKARRERVLCHTLCPNLAIYRCCGQLRRFVPFQLRSGLSSVYPGFDRMHSSRENNSCHACRSILCNKRPSQSMSYRCHRIIFLCRKLLNYIFP